MAYGVAPLLCRGIDGRGDTVVLPELADTPSHRCLMYTNISKDLRTARDSARKEWPLPGAVRLMT